MSELFALFALLGGLAVVLANIAIWSPRRLAVKLAALAITLVLLPAGWLALTGMLGRAKPADLEWARRHVPEATVHASLAEEGKAIYLWLGFDGGDGPRAYVLPWSEQMARQLHGARRQAEETGARLRMRRPFETTLDEREPVFYAPPPPPPPLKERPGENPFAFQRAQRESEPDAR